MPKIGTPIFQHGRCTRPRARTNAWRAADGINRLQAMKQLLDIRRFDLLQPTFSAYPSKKGQARSSGAGVI